MQTLPQMLAIALCVLSGAWAPIVSATGGRIAAGQNATVGQFPWQVSLIMDRTHFCGGALVAPNWVLTSASCTQRYSAFIVSLGSLYPDSHAVEQTISHEKFVHPDFDADTDANDVGLIQLGRNINFTDTISAVEIEGSTASFTGFTARVAGWGYPSAKLMDNLLPTLQWTEAAVLDEQKCSEDLGLTIDDGHLCTSGTNKSGICAGDDGGGLVLSMDGHWRLVGVATSSSTAGCGTGTPSVYTRVSKHAEWITSVTGIVVTATPSSTTPSPSAASGAAGRFLLMCGVLGVWIWRTTTSYCV